MEKYRIAITNVINPYTEKPLTEDDIQNISGDQTKIVITLNHLGNDEIKNQIVKNAVIKVLKQDLQVQGVKFSYTPAPENENGAPPVTNFHDRYPHTKVIGIMSGKGGVGKSVVTTNLAKILAKKYQVGLVDADIYGYSIPKIFERYDNLQVENGIIKPLQEGNLTFVSTQYVIENNENRAVVWRGPMLDKLLTHFFFDVAWPKDLDYLIIDFPPGTGDVHISLAEIVPNAEIFLVTTPDPAAAYVAERSGQFTKSHDLNLRGVIENMSWYPHGNEQLPIFGIGGGQIIATNLNVPLITQIPMMNDEDNVEAIYAPIIDKILK